MTVKYSIRTRAGMLCGISNKRLQEKHVQRRQKLECAVQCFCLLRYHPIGIINFNRRWQTGKNYKSDEDDLYDAWMCNYLWKWQCQRRTKAIVFLLLRPDWLRRTRSFNNMESERVLFAQKSTLQKTTTGTQHLLYSRIGVFICHCSGELQVDDLVEITAR